MSGGTPGGLEAPAPLARGAGSRDLGSRDLGSRGLGSRGLESRDLWGSSGGAGGDFTVFGTQVVRGPSDERSQ